MGGKRVLIEVRIIDGIEVLGKVCAECSKWKPLEGFHKQVSCLGGVNSKCKVCRNASRTKNYHKDIEKSRERRKELYQVRRDVRRKESVDYYIRNRESILTKRKAWYEENKEKSHENTTLYNARRKSLPGSLTKKVEGEVLLTYESACALTGEKTNLQIDHVVPIITGHMGNFLENLIPIKSSLNNSKYSSNVFEWFNLYGESLGIEEWRFIGFIDRIANSNRLTSEEYRQFVYWCYDNKRSVDEIKRDQRHSIEIWREATGKQFPLPRYVYEVGFLNEDESEVS